MFQFTHRGTTFHTNLHVAQRRLSTACASALSEQASLAARRSFGSLAIRNAPSEDWSNGANAQYDLSLRWSRKKYCSKRCAPVQLSVTLLHWSNNIWMIYQSEQWKFWPDCKEGLSVFSLYALIWFHLTLLLLNTTCPVLANSVDPDQLASEESNWSESALFVIKYVNFYQKSGSSNLIGWKLEVGVAS